MMSFILAALLHPGLTSAAALQDPAWTEIRFHRVYLRNGNFIDGTLVRQTEKEIVLKISAGEIGIRTDQVDRLEFVKMRAAKEAPQVIKPRTALPPVDRRDPLTKPPAFVPSTAGKVPLFDASPEIRKKVDALMAELRHANSESKMTVMEELGLVGGDAGPYLASLLDKIDRSDASVVTAAVVKNKDMRAIPILGALTKSEDAMVRTAAASGLGGLADDSSIPFLLLLLTDKDPTVKGTAISSLAENPNRSSLDAVMGLLSDPDRDVRTRAIQTAASISNKLSLNGEYISGIVRALDDASLNARFDLISALGQAKATDKWRTIADYLSNDSPELRSIAASTLGRLGAPEAGDAIASQALRETDGRVKLQIASAARQLAVKGAIDPMILWLQEDNEQVRGEVRSALEGLTGQRFGNDAAAWGAWWAQNRPK